MCAKLERGLAVDAKDGILDLGVGRRVVAAGHQLVAGGDVFHLAHGARVDDVFQHHGIARLVDGKVGLGGHDHAEGLHVGDGLHFAGTALQDHFAQIDGPSFRGNRPHHVGEIFEAEFGGFIDSQELGVDLDAAPFVLHFGFAAGLLHQFGALEIDLDGAAGAPVVHGLGGARNTPGGARGRGALRRPAKNTRGDRAEHT